MTDAVVDEIDGRMIRVGDQWLADFASCNYLGFDLDPEIISVIPEYLQKWGTHPSWSRLLGSPALYEQIEERLTKLLGCEDTLILPTITLIHMSVIPVLAGGGTIFMESRAHKTIYEGCQFATARGATMKKFRIDDLDGLEHLLQADRSGRRLICIDGVNSMTGNIPDLPALARLARRYDAILYVDDAHGFGVLGERADDEPNPYGLRGNSIVRHFGESYDNVILVAGFSKAYSSLAAFIACPTELKRDAEDGRVAVSVLGSVACRVARHGDRRVRRQRCARRGAPDGSVAQDGRGARLPRPPGRAHPQPLRAARDRGAARTTRGHRDVGRFLFDNGIYVTLAAYPLVPKSEVGFRIQTTAANTYGEIEQLVDVLGKLADRFDLQPAHAERAHERLHSEVRAARSTGRPPSWPVPPWKRRVWIGYLVVAGALTLLYLFAPSLAGNALARSTCWASPRRSRSLSVSPCTARRRWRRGGSSRSGSSSSSQAISTPTATQILHADVPFPSPGMPST